MLLSSGDRFPHLIQKPRSQLGFVTYLLNYLHILFTSTPRSSNWSLSSLLSKTLSPFRISAQLLVRNVCLIIYHSLNSVSRNATIVICHPLPLLWQNFLCFSVAQAHCWGSWLIDWLHVGSGPYNPDAPRPLLTGPLCPITIYGNPVALPKFQMAPRLTFLIFPGSKKKEHRYACLSEARASHRQRIWAEVSSSALHFLHNWLSISPIKCRCLLRVLYPVRKPVTALDCILLKDKSLALVPRQGPEINSRACLCVFPRIRHRPQCWFINQRLPG
jgi:hypothetical protein